MKDFVGILKNRFGQDEPIAIADIISEFADVSIPTVYACLNEAMASGDIERVIRGVYYLPRQGALGKVPLLPYKAIARKYLDNGSDVYGYVSGLNLQNEVGVSPQVPATLEITTNNASRRVRDIKPFGGWRRITLRKPYVEVTRDNVNALKLLDLLTAVRLETLSAAELNNIIKLSTATERCIVNDCVRSYPAKTAKRLIESAAYGVFA
ncbi:MAG: hypothetical protein LBP28_07670 [Coriobacteriales bacterium]|jgi:hypothetical protein|nr:hypothetical protein [Coriobacteriales bacterium]